MADLWNWHRGRYLGELKPTWRGNKLVQCVENVHKKNYYE